MYAMNMPSEEDATMQPEVDREEWRAERGEKRGDNIRRQLVHRC